MGFRPCHERLDTMYICRSTALLCPRRRWADALGAAKAWIPPAHPRASLLYLYDGQTQEAFDAKMQALSPNWWATGSP